MLEGGDADEPKPERVKPTDDDVPSRPQSLKRGREKGDDGDQDDRFIMEVLCEDAEVNRLEEEVPDITEGNVDDWSHCAQHHESWADVWAEDEETCVEIINVERILVTCVEVPKRSTHSPPAPPGSSSTGALASIEEWAKRSAPWTASDPC